MKDWFGTILVAIALIVGAWAGYAIAKAYKSPASCEQQVISQIKEGSRLEQSLRAALAESEMGNWPEGKK